MLTFSSTLPSNTRKGTGISMHFGVEFARCTPMIKRLSESFHLTYGL